MILPIISCKLKQYSKEKLMRFLRYTLGMSERHASNVSHPARSPHSKISCHFEFFFAPDSIKIVLDLNQNHKNVTCPCLVN